MCNKKNDHFDSFNPPVHQRNVIQYGEDQNDVKSTELEKKESRRNRRRRNRKSFHKKANIVALADNDMGRKVRNVSSFLDPNLVRNEGEQESADEDINILYDYTGKIFDFFAKEFKRNSIDGKGMDLDVMAHYRVEKEMKLANAYWDLKDMVIRIGEGDSMRKSYAKDLTVVAHEFTHGIIQFSGGMNSTNEAGAINESIADIFACMIEQYYNWNNKEGTFPDVNVPQTTANASWVVGSYLFKENHPYYQEGMAVRSLKAPGTAYDHKILRKDDQPKHFNEYKKNGGAWHNCSIPSHAFYLLANKLGGHSWEIAGQIWYYALLENDDPGLDLRDWAKLTKKAARKLFGRNDAFDAVKDAWDAVGVKH